MGAPEVGEIGGSNKDPQEVRQEIPKGSLCRTIDVYPIGMVVSTT